MNVKMPSNGNFSCFCFQKSFRNISISNGFDLDQDRQNILSVLIWAQTVCKGYQQMTKVAASDES